MFRFSIDRGGTFTDVYAECPGGKVRVLKLLSEDPDNYSDAPREAIRRIMEEVHNTLTLSCTCLYLILHVSCAYAVINHSALPEHD